MHNWSLNKGGYLQSPTLLTTFIAYITIISDEIVYTILVKPHLRAMLHVVVISMRYYLYLFVLGLFQLK